MIIEQIPLEAVDLGDETFRISEDLESASLRSSLAAIGQLNPVVLLNRVEGPRIVVCGFRRVRALVTIGADRLLARTIPEESSALHAFSIALWDNLSCRQLSPLENARVLSTLKYTCGVPDDALVKTYLGILGLKPHKNVLRSYLALHALDPGIKRLLCEGRLTLSSAERLARATPAAQQRLASLFQKMRLSASLQRHVLDLIEELAAIEDCGIDEVLNHPQILTILDDSRLSLFERGEKVHEILYRCRNPRLSEAEERFMDGKEELELPGGIRLVHDSFFESPQVRVEFDASSAQDFRDLAEALYRASRTAALDRLFRVS